jgi:hypothetical protein
MLGWPEQEQDPQHKQEQQQEKHHESLWGWARLDSALAAEYCELRESLGDLVALLKAYHAAALSAHTYQYEDARYTAYKLV